MAKKWTIDSVRQYVREQGEELLSDVYVNYQTKMSARCNICNQPYDITMNNYTKGRRHRPCVLKKNRHTYDYVYEFIRKRGDHLIDEEYNTQRDYINIECGDCGTVNRVTFTQYVQKKTCTMCGNEGRRRALAFDYNYVKQYVSEQGEELVSTKYDNAQTPLEIRCRSCKEIYSMTLHCFRDGHRCTCYTTSRLARAVDDYLTTRKINFVTEKRFDDCRNINPLPFDFYLPDYDYFIETDGRQHFNESDFFGDLRIRQECDIIKTKYAVQTKRILLRIAYTDEKKINDLLDRFFADEDPPAVTYSSPTMYTYITSHL